jgi:UrcA family protein
MKRVNLAAALLATVAATLTVSTAAQAQGEVVVEGRPTIQVSYADLNVASKTGLATLKGRVRAAATQLCDANGINLLRERVAAEQCRNDAIEGAREQIAFAANNSGASAVAAASQAASTIAVSLR